MSMSISFGWWGNSLEKNSPTCDDQLFILERGLTQVASQLRDAVFDFIRWVLHFPSAQRKSRCRDNLSFWMNADFYVAGCLIRSKVGDAFFSLSSEKQLWTLVQLTKRGGSPVVGPCSEHFSAAGQAIYFI